MKTQRTALVTGANRGIGHEVAKELASAGMRVILTGRDASAAAAAAEAIRRAGGAAVALGMDVADRAAVEACADQREEHRGRQEDDALSKAALNALTLKLASDVSGDVKVNAVCPGWVRTRMGGSGARESVAQGADTIVWLATLDADGPSGGFFRNRRRIDW